MPPNNDAPTRTRPRSSAFATKPCLRCGYDLRSQIGDKDTILVCPECNWQGKVGQLYDPAIHGPEYETDLGSLVRMVVVGIASAMAMFFLLGLL